MLDTLLSLDTDLFVLINGHWRADILDRLAGLFGTDPLYIGVAIGALCTVVAVRGIKFMPALALIVCVLALSVGTSDVCATLVKRHTERQRPYNVLPLVHIYRDKEWEITPADMEPKKARNFSFYSGHATNSMAFAATMAAIYPPIAPFIYGCSLGIGYSRIYIGKHYPLDVAAGWLAGLIIGKCWGIIYWRIRKRHGLLCLTAVSKANGQTFPALFGLDNAQRLLRKVAGSGFG